MANHVRIATIIIVKVKKIVSFVGFIAFNYSYQVHYKMRQNKDVGESETVLSIKVIEQILQLLLNSSHE